MAWIEKRGKKWRVNWDIGTPENRDRRVASFDTPEEANQFKKKVEYELSTGTYIDVSKMTVGEYMDHWIRLHGDKLEPMTLNSYKHQIKNHIKPRLGKIKLAKLSPLHLVDFYQHELLEGKADVTRTRMEKMIKDQGAEQAKKSRNYKRAEKQLEKMKNEGTAGLSPTSVNYLHRILHKALKQAVKWQMVGRNVADAVDPPPKNKTELSYLHKQHVKAFISLIQDSSDYPIISAAIFTGMRQGELIGLRWQDIDFDHAIIHIRQQIQYLPETGRKPKKPKRGKMRDIPLPLNMNALLRKVKKAQDVIKEIYSEANKKDEQSEKYQDQDLVFCNYSGSPLDGTALTKRFQKLLVENGFEKIRFHSLRHTFATMARAAGIPLEDLQDLLGHADISTTKNMYVHIEIEPLRKSMSKLEEYYAE